MRYVDVLWKHSHAEEPVRLISELDADGWERRKLEFFADGRVGHAFGTVQSGGTRLGEAIVPSIREINAMGEFEGREIEASEFERLWGKHVRNAT